MRTALPPGPRLPGLLSAMAWWYRPKPFLRRCQARYGDMFSLRITPDGTWVVVSHPDQVKQVFTADPAVALAGKGNAIIQPLVGPQSVLTLDGGAHLEQRKLMLPPFHGQRTRAFAAVMREVAEREIATWPTGTPFALLPRMRAMTMEIILRTIFGVHETARMDRLRGLLEQLLARGEELKVVLAMVALGPDRLAASTPWRRGRAALDALLVDEIRTRRAARDLEERDDVLSLLVQARHEDGTPMADEELRDELITLLAAGHETSATALAWAMERLVRDPDRLARVASGDEAYVDAVAKETLRLRPVIPVAVRMLAEPMEVGGWVLPAGVRVVPSVDLLHRRADLYPEPGRFVPERFLDRPPGTYTWIPFGGGVRRCLGATFALQEMSVVLRTVAQRMRLRPADPAPEGTSRRAIALTPARGAAVVAEPA